MLKYSDGIQPNATRNINRVRTDHSECISSEITCHGVITLMTHWSLQKCCPPSSAKFARMIVTTWAATRKCAPKYCKTVDSFCQWHTSATMSNRQAYVSLRCTQRRRPFLPIAQSEFLYPDDERVCTTCCYVFKSTARSTCTNSYRKRSVYAMRFC